MSKIEIAQKIILKYINDAPRGLFNTRNLVGDNMEPVYDDGDLKIDICYDWAYFEVFGLTEEEFAELEHWYNMIKGL